LIIALQRNQGIHHHLNLHEAASNLEFEEAARLSDEIKKLEELDLMT